MANEPFNPQPPTSRSKLSLFIILVICAILIGGAAYYFFVYSNKDTNENSNQESNKTNSSINQNINLTNQSLNSNILVNKTNTNPVTNTNSIANTTGGLLNNTLVIKNTDTDSDGVYDINEQWIGLDITKADTDGDSYTDFQEINSCHNPLGTGIMTTTIYKAYCEKYLAYLNSKGTYSISATNAQSICELWSPLAQKVITARVNGNTDLASLFENDPEFDSTCTQTERIVGGNTNDSTICATMDISTKDLCDTTGLTMLAS